MAYKFKTTVRKTKEQRADDQKMMDELLEALRAEHGVLDWGFKRSGVTRNIYLRLCREYPEFEDEVKLIREETKDFVFGQLMKLVEELHPASTIFAAKVICHLKENQVNKTTLEIKGAHDLVDVNKALDDISKIVEDKDKEKDGGEQQD